MLQIDSNSSDAAVLETTYTLSHDISAIQILPHGDAGSDLSPVSRLPRGARIHACGAGHNGDTLKVAYEGQYFLVFLDDLEAQRKAMNAAV